MKAVHIKRYLKNLAQNSNPVDLELFINHFTTCNEEDSNHLLGFILDSWRSDYSQDSYIEQVVDILKIALKIDTIVMQTAINCIEFIKNGLISGLTASNCIAQLKLWICSIYPLVNTFSTEKAVKYFDSFLNILESCKEALLLPNPNVSSCNTILELLPSICQLLETLSNFLISQDIDNVKPNPIDVLLDCQFKTSDKCLLYLNVLLGLFEFLKFSHILLIQSKIITFLPSISGSDFTQFIEIILKFLNISYDDSWAHLLRRLYHAIPPHFQLQNELLLRQIFQTSWSSTYQLVGMLEQTALLLISHYTNEKMLTGSHTESYNNNSSNSSSSSSSSGSSINGICRKEYNGVPGIDISDINLLLLIIDSLVESKDNDSSNNFCDNNNRNSSSSSKNSNDGNISSVLEPILPSVLSGSSRHYSNERLLILCSRVFIDLLLCGATNLLVHSSFSNSGGSNNSTSNSSSSIHNFDNFNTGNISNSSNSSNNNIGVDNHSEPYDNHSCRNNSTSNIIAENFSSPSYDDDDTNSQGMVSLSVTFLSQIYECRNNNNNNNYINNNNNNNNINDDDNNNNNNNNNNINNNNNNNNESSTTYNTTETGTTDTSSFIINRSIHLLTCLFHVMANPTSTGLSCINLITNSFITERITNQHPNNNTNTTITSRHHQYFPSVSTNNNNTILLAQETPHNISNNKTNHNYNNQSFFSSEPYPPSIDDDEDTLVKQWQHLWLNRNNRTINNTNTSNSNQVTDTVTSVPVIRSQILINLISECIILIFAKVEVVRKNIFILLLKSLQPILQVEDTITLSSDEQTTLYICKYTLFEIFQKLGCPSRRCYLLEISAPLQTVISNFLLLSLSSLYEIFSLLLPLILNIPLILDHFILLLNNILINNDKENNSIHNNLPKKIFAIQYLLILLSEIKEESKQLKIIKIIINELSLQHKSNSIIYIQLIKILQNENKAHFISKHCLFELQTFLERKLAKICYFYNNYLVFIHPLSFLIDDNTTTTQNDSLEFNISENIGYVSSLLFCIEHCSSSSSNNIAKRLKEIIKDMNALEPLIYCGGSDDSKKSQIYLSTDSTATTTSSSMASKSITTTSNTKGSSSPSLEKISCIEFIGAVIRFIMSGCPFEKLIDNNNNSDGVGAGHNDINVSNDNNDDSEGNNSMAIMTTSITKKISLWDLEYGIYYHQVISRSLVTSFLWMLSTILIHSTSKRSRELKQDLDIIHSNSTYVEATIRKESNLNLNHCNSYSNNNNNIDVDEVSDVRNSVTKTDEDDEDHNLQLAVVQLQAILQLMQVDVPKHLPPPSSSSSVNPTSPRRDQSYKSSLGAAPVTTPATINFFSNIHKFSTILDTDDDNHNNNNDNNYIDGEDISNVPRVEMEDMEVENRCSELLFDYNCLEIFSPQQVENLLFVSRENLMALTIPSILTCETDLCNITTSSSSSSSSSRINSSVPSSTTPQYTSSSEVSSLKDVFDYNVIHTQQQHHQHQLPTSTSSLNPALSMASLLYIINHNYLYYTKKNLPFLSSSETSIQTTSTTLTLSTFTSDIRKSTLHQFQQIYNSLASLQQEDYWLQYVEAEEFLTNRKFILEYSCNSRRVSRRVTDAAGRVHYEELSDLSDFEGTYRRVNTVGSIDSILGIYSAGRGRTIADTIAFPKNMFLYHYSNINKNSTIERIIPKLPKLLSQFCQVLRNENSSIDVCYWDVTCSVLGSEVSSNGGTYNGNGTGHCRTKRRRNRVTEEEEGSAWFACRKTLFKLREEILHFERYLWESFKSASPSSKFEEYEDESKVRALYLASEFTRSLSEGLPLGLAEEYINILKLLSPLQDSHTINRFGSILNNDNNKIAHLLLQSLLVTSEDSNDMIPFPSPFRNILRLAFQYFDVVDCLDHCYCVIEALGAAYPLLYPKNTETNMIIHNNSTNSNQSALFEVPVQLLSSPTHVTPINHNQWTYHNLFHKSHKKYQSCLEDIIRIIEQKFNQLLSYTNQRKRTNNNNNDKNNILVNESFNSQIVVNSIKNIISNILHLLLYYFTYEKQVTTTLKTSFTVNNNNSAFDEEDDYEEESTVNNNNNNNNNNNKRKRKSRSISSNSSNLQYIIAYRIWKNHLPSPIIEKILLLLRKFVNECIVELRIIESRIQEFYRLRNIQIKLEAGILKHDGNNNDSYNGYDIWQDTSSTSNGVRNKDSCTEPITSIVAGSASRYTSRGDDINLNNNNMTDKLNHYYFECNLNKYNVDNNRITNNNEDNGVLPAYCKTHPDFVYLNSISYHTLHTDCSNSNSNSSNNYATNKGISFLSLILTIINNNTNDNNSSKSNHMLALVNKTKAFKDKIKSIQNDLLKWDIVNMKESTHLVDELQMMQTLMDIINASHPKPLVRNRLKRNESVTDGNSSENSEVENNDMFQDGLPNENENNTSQSTLRTRHQKQKTLRRGKFSKKHRIRSRNRVIDAWLSEPCSGSDVGGEDAFVDLEEFIV